MPRKWRLFLSLLIIVFGLVLILFPRRGRKEIGEREGISFDPLKKEIKFFGFVQRNTGWVRHLIYLEGYKWLKDSSAIVSPLPLKRLQLALAKIDFYLWDSLWQGKIKEKRIKLFIDNIPAESLVRDKKDLEVYDLLFFGSPQFDHIALSGDQGLCAQCPLFDLEKKSFDELFGKRKGLFLREGLLPAGKRIELRLRVD